MIIDAFFLEKLPWQSCWLYRILGNSFWDCHISSD